MYLTNTKKQTNWALCIFADWRACRISNANAGTELCPSDLLENPNKEKLNHWLSLFVNEVRNTKGSQYPPRTIQQILAGLQRYLIEINPVDSYKFMDKKNSNFRDFHRACDSVYRQLHAGGVGVVVHHSKAFSVEEEDLFWNKGIMSDSNPVRLQRAVFFYVGKHFCLRGGGISSESWDRHSLYESLTQIRTTTLNMDPKITLAVYINSILKTKLLLLLPCRLRDQNVWCIF
jgi:hypothetical protein